MTTDAERSEWHRRIEETPFDLALREVFADWLLGQGDPLGELIQLECKVIREPRSPEKRSWQRRAGALRKEHGTTFFGPDCASVETRGGMIEEAPLSFYKNGRSLPTLDSLLAHAPALVYANVSNSYVEEPELAKIVEHPLWRRLRTIHVSSRAVPVIHRVLEHTELPRLEELRVQGLSSTDSSLLRWLVDGDQPSRTPRLTRLELPLSDGLVADDFSVLARMKPLTLLDLYSDPLTVESVRALAAGSVLRGITDLRLGNTQLGSAGLSALASSEHLATLRHVDLRRVRFQGDADALSAFASATPALRALELMGNPLKPAAVAIVARHDLWRELDELSLQDCGLDDEGLALVLRHPRRLRALNLKSNKLTDAAVDIIVRAPTAPALVSLNLEGTAISAEGAKRLAASTQLASAVVSAGPKASSIISAPTNEKLGLWLGSTNCRAQDVIASPALREPSTKASPKKRRSS